MGGKIRLAENGRKQGFVTRGSGFERLDGARRFGVGSVVEDKASVSIRDAAVEGKRSPREGEA
jgi:hypothetical protein